MKKFLSLLLVAIMLLAVVPIYAFTASAADDYMGEEPENPMAAFVISTDGGYIAGAPLTVTVTVKDVKFEKGLNGLKGSFYYDNSVLTLENGTLSSGALDCLTKAPYVGGLGEEWYKENFSKVEADGTITLATMGGIAESDIYAKDGDIVFTLNFTVAEGTTGDLLFYITNTDCVVMGDDDFATLYPAKGASLTVCEIPCSLGHDYEAVRTEPTCTEDGYTTYTCTRCGDSYTNIEGSLGYDYEAVRTEPTCTEDGYTTYTCTRCGDSYTNIEGSLGHNYESVRTEPTCTEDGYEINTCTRCGDSYTNVLTASGHVYGESWEDSDNWIVDGDGCVTFPNAYGYVFDIDRVDGPIHGEDAAIITSEEAYLCSNPNWAISVALVATETEGVYSVLKVVVTPGSASGADINWDRTDLVLVVHSATCDPAEEYRFPNWRSKCAAMALNIGDRVCYDEEAATVTVLGGHSLVVTAPTCTEGGYTTYTCARCEYSYIADETDALGHDYDSVVTAPTCTEGGYTTHTCATCGDSYVDSEVAALGHLPGPEADCENDQICLNNCGLVYEEAHGHKYDRFVTLPTCTEGGYTLYVCSVCKDGQIGDIVAALGHDYDSVVTAPTCTEGGYTTHTCATCGDVLVDSYVDALGHTYITKVVKPTCTEQGYSEHTCSGCDKVIVDSYVDALGHTEGEWETLPNGNLELNCDVCGELLDSKIIYAEGDVNGDGKVNLFDYMAVKSYCLDKNTLPEDQLERADLTGDGRVNMFDYIALKKIVIGG